MSSFLSSVLAWCKANPALVAIIWAALTAVISAFFAKEETDPGKLGQFVRLIEAFGFDWRKALAALKALVSGAPPAGGAGVSGQASGGGSSSSSSGSSMQRQSVYRTSARPAEDRPRASWALRGVVLAAWVATLAILVSISGCVAMQHLFGSPFPSDAVAVAKCVDSEIVGGEANVVKIIEACGPQEEALVLDAVDTFVGSPGYAADHPAAAVALRPQVAARRSMAVGHASCAP